MIRRAGVCSVMKKFCFLLALTAVCMALVTVRDYVQIRPADCYEDEGVYEFIPYEVLPVTVQNTSGSRQSRRTRPVKTVYMLYYRASGGSGYRWSREVITRSTGQALIAEGETVERRVLSIAGENTYISIEPKLTAESYTDGLRRRSILRFSVCILYLFLYGAFRLWRRRVQSGYRTDAGR